MTSFSTFKHFAIAGFVAAALGGCASSVPLDAPPVEDRTASAAAGASSAAGSQPGTEAAGANNRSVQAVDLSKSGQMRLGPVGERIVYFDYDSFVVKSEYQNLLETQAKYLKADKARKAVIEGHTDERGGREYNLALGQKRAEAVRRSLGLMGVVDAQVEAVSFGKEKLAMQANDEAAAAKNRRAEVTYR
jgi:peptidoglycan-associated lipoprotein